MARQEHPNAPVMDDNLLYEVMRRVDGLTLATSSCVSSSFADIAKDEALWECLCAMRWPSTRQPSVKSMVLSIGGFRRFFKECYPLLSPLVEEQEDESESWSDSNEEEDADSDWSPSRFVSIVDVVFQGRPIISRSMEGIPGASDYEWFSSCPFRIDIVTPAEDQPEDHDLLGGLDGLRSVEDSLGKEKKEGKLWKSLLQGLRLSWVLIDKRTNRLANLSSWKPITGQRHWPTDDCFCLRFASILPTKVQCNIAIKFSLSSSYLRLVELSMQLEDMAGLHLNGRESIAVLCKSLGSRKSYKHSEVLRSCRWYLKRQNDIRASKLQGEGRRDTYTVLGFVGVFIWLIMSLV